MRNPPRHYWFLGALGIVSLCILGRESRRNRLLHEVNVAGVDHNSKLRVVAYSLYGKKPRYGKGMINVAKRTPQVFPQWQVWVYHDNTVPPTVLGNLTEGPEMAHVKLINVETSLPSWVHKDLSPPTWRFLVAANTTVDAYALRDSDSLPSAREFAAVEEWLRSDKAFHLMRDHPGHHPQLACPIMAGMWGGRSWAVPQMDRLLHDYFASNETQQQKNVFGIDQDFLWHILLPLLYQDVLQHDSYYCREANAIAFPIAREESYADGNNSFWYVGNRQAQNNVFREAKIGKFIKRALVNAEPRYKTCLEDRRHKEQQLLHQGIPKELFGKYSNTTFSGKLDGSYIEATKSWFDRLNEMNNSYY